MRGQRAGSRDRCRRACRDLDAGGATVAVLGTGPDIAYPSRHRALLERIAGHGAVVSEHPPGTEPLRQFFPSRNRILAGLCLGRPGGGGGGTLRRAHHGAAGGGGRAREVFALPGSIHNPMARGCHRLIRDGAPWWSLRQEVLAVIGPLAADLARALRGELGAPIHTTEPIPDPRYCPIQTTTACGKPWARPNRYG